MGHDLCFVSWKCPLNSLSFPHCYSEGEGSLKYKSQAVYSQVQTYFGSDTVFVISPLYTTATNLKRGNYNVIEVQTFSFDSSGLKEILQSPFRNYSQFLPIPLPRELLGLLSQYVFGLYPSAQ